MTSSIANSSATRIGGLYSDSELPSTTTAALSARREMAAAMMLGEGISP
ncbi:MAG: hypothetical protein IPH23_14785 [Gammaproteobacteria bacterium]|nr:hypothetical protein [Gammaproteobacteria bacterium]